MVMQRVLGYLVVLLFVIAVLNSMVLVKLTEQSIAALQQQPSPNTILGYAAGTVSMTVQVCGDNTVHGTEQCDGNDLNNQTCADQGFGSGMLSCTSNCTFNTSGCTGDTTAPNVDLLWPMNNSNFSWRDVYFGYSTTDAASGISNCKLFLNAALRKTSNKVDETIPQYFSVTNLANGNYTWQVNCTDSSANQNVGSSVIRKFQVIVSEGDDDGDGIDDDFDHFLGSNTSVNTSTMQAPVIMIANSSNMSQNFTGTQTVTLTDNGMEMLTFSFNFDAAVLDLRSFKMEIEDFGASIGQFEIGNLNLPAGVTKTVYLNKVDTTITAVCIKDAAGAVVDDISNGCSGAGETRLTCDGSTNNGYSCTDLGDRFKVTGLQHSAGKQQGTSGTGGTSSTSGGSTAQSHPGQPAPSSSPQAPSAPSTSAAHPAEAIAAARPTSTPQPSAPTKSDLFDVAVDTVLDFKEVLRGKEVLAQISLFYLGDERIDKRVDVAVYYAILDDDERIIAEKLETVGIQTRATIVGKLTLPPDAPAGKYWFYSRINVGKEVAEAFDRFSVVEQATLEQPRPIIPQQYLVILLFLISLFLLITVHHQYRLEKHLAEHHRRLSDEDVIRLGNLMKKEKER